MSSMGLIYGSRFEDIDHLAPLMEILGIPLFVTDEEIRKIIEIFYPAVNVQLQIPNDLGKKLLATGNTVISCMPTVTIRRLLGLEEMMAKRQLHTIFLPHGYSPQIDKTILAEKNVLVLGKKMIDLFYSLSQVMNFETLVSVGNYRYLYYQKNKEFMQQRLESWYNNCAHHRAVFFPTDFEEPEHIVFLRENLIANWDLFVVHHPINATDPIIKVLKESEKLTTPYIYPYLGQGALFVVEESNVVYDALFFETPTFFFKDHPELDTLGIKFDKNMEEGLKKVEHLKNKKKEILPYAFDLYPSLDAIKVRLELLLSGIGSLDDYHP
jgi:hypothetical protein